MKPRDLGLTYHQALHGMQSAVAFDHDRGGRDGEPKHLRVGVNSAHVAVAALAKLLIDKGVITLDEIEEANRLAMNEEVAQYQDRAGPNITFR